MDGYVPGEWQHVGDIALCARRWPLFDKVPGSPGLYRITLRDGWV